MIYDYLDKWLTVRCRIMEIVLSYEIHRKRHVGFSDHLICWQVDPPAQSDAQGFFSPVTPNILLPHELDSYCWPQVPGPRRTDMILSISTGKRNVYKQGNCLLLCQLQKHTRFIPGPPWLSINVKAPKVRSRICINYTRLMLSAKD